MTTELRELEQKYEARPGMILPPLDGLPKVAKVSGPQEETLTADYYDTQDLRLLQEGITLRRREGGTDAGWHLKLPDDDAGGEGTSSRREVRVPFGQAARGSGDQVPGELAGLVRAYTRGMPLLPVARIETRRHRSVLRGADGASLAEVVADEVAAQTLGASTTLTRWDEVEVELTGGDPSLLKAAAKRLRRGGLRPAGYSAKIERALADSLPGQDDDQAAAVPAPGTLSAASPAGDVVLAYVAAQAARLKALDPAVRRDEPDAVHQMRVSTRRLRAALRAFPRVLPKPAASRLRNELRWLGQALGESRDSEVLSGHLTELASAPGELVPAAVLARITAHFTARQAAARAEIMQALDSRRYLAILDELDSLLGDPPRPAEARAPARDVLPRAIAKAHRRARRRMRRAQHMPPGPARDTALHQARKAARRARYTAEAATPALGKDARRFAGRMKKVQSTLGDYHDAVAAGTACRQISAHALRAGEDTFSFGLLADRTRQQAEEAGYRAGKAWKRATRRKATRVTRR